MCEELKTIEMEYRPIVCGNVYINVPGGDELRFYNLLIKIVEDIGEKYGSIRGSNLKKGIHYIYSKTECSSKRQIKMMMRNVPRACIHERNDVGFIFRCSRKHYIELLGLIIKFSPYAKDLQPSRLVPDTIDGLRYVANNGRGGIYEEAYNMVSKLDDNNIDKWV